MDRAFELLGLAAAAFMRFGVNVLALVIGALVLACLLFKGGRETLVICVDSLAEGAKNALPVGIACAIVGIVIGTLTLTGIASTLIDGRSLDAWRAAIKPNTKVLFLETPANPTLEIIDLRAVADIAHRGGARLIVPRCCYRRYAMARPHWRRPRK